MPDLGWMCCRK